MESREVFMRSRRVVELGKVGVVITALVATFVAKPAAAQLVPPFGPFAAVTALVAGARVLSGFGVREAGAAQLGVAAEVRRRTLTTAVRQRARPRGTPSASRSSSTNLSARASLAMPVPNTMPPERPVYYHPPQPQLICYDYIQRYSNGYLFWDVPMRTCNPIN